MSLTQDITGQIALVTGGSSGLGQAAALRLADAGAHVVVLGRNQEGLDETVAAIAAKGGTAKSIRGDLSESGTLEAAVDKVVADTGHLNILVNNAAVMYMEHATDAPRDRWEQMFRINVFAAIEGTQAAIKHMREKDVDGHIVNISSLASRLAGGGIYGATKSALERFADQLRLELEDDKIRITTIVPGGFSTNLGRDLSEAQQAAFGEAIGAQMANLVPDADGRTPLFGIPDDIARAVVFAVSQPIYLNIFEMVVRPSKNIDPAAFME